MTSRGGVCTGFETAAFEEVLAALLMSSPISAFLELASFDTAGPEMPGGASRP